MNSDRLKRHSFRRVAILIQLVNDSLADFLLSKMSLREAATVRRMAEELEEVDAHERERVIQDFLDQTGWAREDVMSHVAARPRAGGVELELSDSVQPSVENPLRESLMENPGRADKTTSCTEPVDASPLGFVKATDVSIMVEMIQRESSSMGTVILSLLRPRIAAQTLEQFDLETRYDLLRRLADKGETHPDVNSEIVDMVQQEIESRLQPTLTPGMQAVQKILETSQWNENEVFMGRVNSRREVNSADSQVSKFPSPIRPNRLKHLPLSNLLRDSHHRHGARLNEKCFCHCVKWISARGRATQTNLAIPPWEVIKTAYWLPKLIRKVTVTRRNPIFRRSTLWMLSKQN
ncbi:MAG: hypothetical protein ACON32_13945 [Pirellulaceae bacterium]